MDDDPLDEPTPPDPPPLSISLSAPAAEGAGASVGGVASTEPLVTREPEVVVDLTAGPPGDAVAGGTDRTSTDRTDPGGGHRSAEAAPVVVAPGSGWRIVLLVVVAALAAGALVWGLVAGGADGADDVPRSTTVTSAASQAGTAPSPVAGAVTSSTLPTQPTAVIDSPLVQERQGDGTPTAESER